MSGIGRKLTCYHIAVLLLAPLSPKAGLGGAGCCGHCSLGGLEECWAAAILLDADPVEVGMNWCNANVSNTILSPNPINHLVDLGINASKNGASLEEPVIS